jgi:hypothetical protein
VYAEHDNIGIEINAIRHRIDVNRLLASLGVDVPLFQALADTMRVRGPLPTPATPARVAAADDDQKPEEEDEDDDDENTPVPVAADEALLQTRLQEREQARDSIRKRITWILIGLWDPRYFDDLYVRVLTPAGVQALGDAWEFMQTCALYHDASMYDAIVSPTVRRTFAALCANFFKEKDVQRPTRYPYERPDERVTKDRKALEYHLQTAFQRVYKGRNTIPGERDLWTAHVAGCR